MRHARNRRGNPAETELERSVVAQIGTNADPEALEIFLAMMRKIQKKARGTAIARKLTAFFAEYSLDAYLQVHATVKERRQALELAGQVLTLSRYDEKACELLELKVRVADKPLLSGHPGSISMMPADSSGDAMATRMGFRSRPMSARLHGSFVELGHTGPRERAAQVAAGAAPEGKPDLVLVGCSETKLPGKHAAKDLYQGGFWTQKRGYAELVGRPWGILSAKHNLLDPDKVIDSYNVGMPGLRSSKSERWAATTVRQIVARLYDQRCPVKGAVVEIHAGKLYVEPLLEGLKKAGIIVRRPLEGLGIGKQRGWYTKKLTPPKFAAPKAALVEDEDGCVVTPGTKIRTCYLAQWNINQDKITARKLSAKRSQDLREHQRALTRTMIEGAVYAENIRNTLMRLRATDMKQATDAAKELRSQQIGWLLARELAVTQTPQAAGRARTAGERRAKLDLDQVYYAPPGFFFEIVGFERRPVARGDALYAIIRQWDATTKTAPGRAPTSELEVDGEKFKALRRAARPVALERMAEIPALPPIAAQRALDHSWKLVVNNTPYSIERDNVEPRYAPFALDLDEKRSKPPTWVWGEPGATREHSDEDRNRRAGRYVIGVDLPPALHTALTREEVMRPGLMQGVLYNARGLHDAPYPLRKLSLSVITVDRVREDPNARGPRWKGAVVEFRVWTPTPGSSLADATRRELPLDSDEWAAIQAGSKRETGRMPAATTPPVPSIRPREDSPGSWSLLVDGRAVAEGLKSEPRWALLSLTESDHVPTWSVVPAKSEKEASKRRAKMRGFVFVIRTQGKVAAQPVELEPGQVVKRGKSTRRRYVVIGRNELGRYELAALSGDARGSSLRSIEIGELTLDKDQTVSFSGRRAAELKAAARERRPSAPQAPAELAPQAPAELAPQAPAELEIPPVDRVEVITEHIPLESGQDIKRLQWQILLNGHPSGQRLLKPAEDVVLVPDATAPAGWSVALAVQQNWPEAERVVAVLSTASLEWLEAQEEALEEGGAPTMAEVVESLEEAAPELEIEATTEGGIVLSGDTRKWKEQIKALRAPRFYFSHKIPGWYVRNTRGKKIDRGAVERAATNLRSAGATVLVSIGEELSYAERQELAAARSEERVERLEAAAEKAQAKAEAAYKSGRAIGDHIPMGQPILVGHHSERRHRRDIERIGRAMDKTVEQTKKAAELTRRADAAEARQERLEDPGAIFRKLEKLRAELRRWQSILAGKNTATGYKIPEPEYAERVQSYAAEAEEKIAYWEAELENAGGLDVAAETVQPGDRISGRFITNAVILAVNKKSYRVESPSNSIPYGMSQYEYKIELERAAGHKSAGSDLKRNQELARAYTNLATIYEPLAESFEGVKYGGDKYSKSLVRKAKSYRNKAARHDKAAAKLEAAGAAYAAREEKEWRPAPEVPDADPQRAQLEERIAVLADDIDVRARSSMPIPGLLVARLERLRAELAQLQTAQAEPPPPPATPERTAMQRASALVRAATGTGPSERSEDFAAWFLPRSIDGGRAIRELMRQIEIELGGAVHATMHKVNGDMTLTLRRNRRWVAPDPNAPPPGGSAEGASIALNWSEELEILQQIPTGWSGRGYTPEQGREFAPLREAMHPAKETGRITLTSDEAILLARALWKAQTILESKIMAYGEGLGRRSHPKRNLEIRLEGVMAVFDRLRKAAKLRMPEDGWPDIPMHERIENPGYPVDEAKRRVMVSLAPDVRKAGWTGPGLGGYCYVASEALAELADEPLTPYRTVHEGSSHWFVRDRRGKVIDLTASQFKTPVPYERAAATPWLEPAPRPQSGMLIRRARRSNPDLTAPAERELAAWTPSLFGTVELERGPAPWAWRLSLVEPDGRRIRAVDVDESGRRTFYTREEQLASPEAELAWSRAPTGAYYAAANAVDLVRLLKVGGEEVPWELLAYLPDEKRRGLKARLSRELAGTREDMYQSVMADDQPEISRSHAKVGFLSDAISQTGKRRKNPAIEQPAQFATLPGMQGCECNDCKAGRACCGDATRVTAGGSIRRANPPDYTPRQISDLTATARSSGAVGANAVVPKLVGKLAADGDHILDYGAGPAELHARRLRKRGHRVSVYEVGDGRGPTHDPRALSRTYDIVYASNVINIQPDGPSVRGVLDDLAKVSRGGLAVVNYPPNPRKPGVTPGTVERWLRERFATVSNVGTPSSPVWIAEGARRTKASPAKRRSNPEDKWIAESVKRPGRIHRHFGIPDDQPIPMARINTEIAALKAKRAREGRYTKAELSLLRALYLARRLKGYARDRDESITTDEERKRGHNPRVDNPITAMTLAQLAPVLAQLMLGPRVMNPTELDEQPYSQLPPRALFVRRAPLKADDLELYAKIDDATARAVIGLQRGCNCKMSGTDSVITTHRRINRLPRRRRR